MRIELRTATGRQQHQLTDTNSTVHDLKQQITSSTGIPVTQMRLVTGNGRVLQPEDASLDEFGVCEGFVIHVTRTASSTSPTTSNVPVVTQSDPDFPPEVAAAMNNPIAQMMLSNPEFIRSMLMSDPRFQRMSEQYPELNHMLNSPSALREISETLRNPRARQEMLRNQDRQLSNIAALPGGMDHLTRMFSAMESAERTENTSEQPNPEGPASPSRNLNTQALPNPWAATAPSTEPPNRNTSGNPLAEMPPPAASQGNPLAALFSGNAPSVGQDGQQANPLAALLGGMPSQGNPLAALFGGMPSQANPSMSNPLSALFGSMGQPQNVSQGQPQNSSQGQSPVNPLAGLFGGLPAGNPGSQANPLAAMLNAMQDAQRQHAQAQQTQGQQANPPPPASGPRPEDYLAGLSMFMSQMQGQVPSSMTTHAPQTRQYSGRPDAQATPSNDPFASMAEAIQQMNAQNPNNPLANGFEMTPMFSFEIPIAPPPATASTQPTVLLGVRIRDSDVYQTFALVDDSVGTRLLDNTEPISVKITPFPVDGVEYPVHFFEVEANAIIRYLESSAYNLDAPTHATAICYVELNPKEPRRPPNMNVPPISSFMAPSEPVTVTIPPVNDRTWFKRPHSRTAPTNASNVGASVVNMPPGPATATTTTIPAPSSTSASSAPTANPQTQPPEVRFASQLAMMADMGFTDRQKCIRALYASAGDVEDAIQYMLEML